MKLLAVLLTACVLSACATRPQSSQALTLDQIRALKWTNRDCPKIDQNIEFLETQLRLRGLTTADPERLSESDRVYNATVRVYIWNLRIGCANPRRFSDT